MKNNNQNESPKCWYCQQEEFWNGDIEMWSKKPVIDTNLMTFNGQYWHRPCLKAYRKVRAYLASQPVQNPLSDNLLTTRKPLGLTKYDRNNIISKRQ